MIRKSQDITPVVFSVRVYQVLLNAYPIKFQQEYGADMAQVFRDSCLRTIRQGRMNGIVRLWVVTLLDLIQSVISEHTQKEIEMKKEMKPEDIRVPGGALIWGAVTFVISSLLLIMGDRAGTITSPFFALSGLLMVFAVPPLLVVGLLGVRNRYGDKVGGFGKTILLLGAILGPLTTSVGFFGSLGLFRNPDLGWDLIYISPAILFTCLALFGVVGLYKRPLPRWNAMPILAGVWYPLIVISYGTINWAENIGILGIIFTIQCIPLVALGYILKSDVPVDTSAPA